MSQLDSVYPAPKNEKPSVDIGTIYGPAFSALTFPVGASVYETPAINLAALEGSVYAPVSANTGTLTGAVYDKLEPVQHTVEGQLYEPVQHVNPGVSDSVYGEGAAPQRKLEDNVYKAPEKTTATLDQNLYTVASIRPTSLPDINVYSATQPKENPLAEENARVGKKATPSSGGAQSLSA